jgi:uncharacterized protein YndB with AHSA1/START domain
MPDIIHKLTIDSKPEQVYEALSTIEGLSNWWTTTTTGNSAPGDRIDFRFGQHLVSMRVQMLDPSKRVAWKCLDDGDWLDTDLTFELSEEGGRTTLLFGHRQWRQSNAFMAHCSMKWATFLLSLRDYVERGTGKPFPNDLQIS